MSPDYVYLVYYEMRIHRGHKKEYLDSAWYDENLANDRALDLGGFVKKKEISKGNPADVTKY